MAQGTGASAVEVSEELAGRLRAVARAVSPDEIGELWIFPPLPDVEASAEFLLFTRCLEEDRRRVYSARLARGGDGDGRGDPGGADGPGGAANGDGSGPRRQRITEHGSVPAGRMDRLVDRFRRRLEGEGEPAHLIIDGRWERWRALLGGEPGVNRAGGQAEGSGPSANGGDADRAGERAAGAAAARVGDGEEAA